MSTSCPSFKPPASKSAWYLFVENKSIMDHPIIYMDTGDDTW